MVQSIISASLVDKTRIRQLDQHRYSGGSILYWMSRDQRVNDNWALLFAYEMAKKFQAPLFVIFNLVPEFLGATLRQYDFMVRGLQEVAVNLEQLHIPFLLFTGQPGKTIPKFIKNQQVGAVICDFSPLRIYRHWKQELATKTDVPLFEVDAHNIIPCWSASPKQEFAARTIRPKIHRQLYQYLQEYPVLKPLSPANATPQAEIDWLKILKPLPVDRSVPPVDWLQPGETGAREMLNTFIQNKLQNYNNQRNDPALAGLSNLSPYLHFGQISAQRIALEIEKTATDKESAEAFLEELIVRRELSDNFCFYNSEYDNWNGLPDWSKKTLTEHKADPREFLYTPNQFESATTHDPVWNACQLEMCTTGKMHGYMRMYWAKKILEWSLSPEEAIQTTVYLNDKYELDGRDPNGYAGILWSIGGLHDRPWFERPVFGKVRYMSSGGLHRKFNPDHYIARVQQADYS